MAHYKGAAKEAGRAATLMKKRVKEQEEAEAKKKKIEEELAIGNIHNKFATHYDAIEQSLKTSTIGLVTLDEMKERQENVVKERERQLAKKHAEARLMEKAKEDKKRKDQKKITMLSFDFEEEEEDDDDGDDNDSKTKDDSPKEIKKSVSDEDVDEVSSPVKEKGGKKKKRLDACEPTQVQESQQEPFSWKCVGTAVRQKTRLHQSTLYRRKLKEENSAKYEELLSRKREKDARRRLEAKRKWENGELTPAEVEARVAKLKIIRARRRARYQYQKMKLANGGQTQNSSVIPGPTETQRKRPRDMTPDELRRHNAEMRKKQRDNLSHQKRTELKRKEREKYRRKKEEKMQTALTLQPDSSTSKYKAKAKQPCMASKDSTQSTQNLRFLRPRTRGRRAAIQVQENSQYRTSLFEEEEHRFNIEEELGITITDSLVEGPPEKEDIPMPLHNKIQLFYCKDEVSKMLPHARYTTKRGPARVMTMPIKNAHTLFKETCPDDRIGLTLFQRLRPKHVRLMGSVPLESCLCHFCTNVRLKIMALNKLLDSSGQIPSETSMLRFLTCPFDGKWPNIKCIDGVCTLCADKIRPFTIFCRDVCRVPVKWRRWERNLEGKIEPFTKDGAVRDLLKEFEEDLVPPRGASFLQHLFTAFWQSSQFKTCRTNPEEDEVVMVQDFSKNREAAYTAEIKSAHLGTKQMAVHPIVCFYLNNDAVIRRSFIFLSDDASHDRHAVRRFTNNTLQLLQQKLHINKVTIWSDGAASQFKGKRSVHGLSLGKDGFQRCLYGCGHGVGEADAEIGLVSQALKQATLEGKSFRSTEEIVTYLSETLGNDKRQFIHVKTIDRVELEEDAQAISSTRECHQFQRRCDGMIQARRLACFCCACRQNKFDRCVNDETVGNYTTQVSKPSMDTAVKEAVVEQDSTQRDENSDSGGVTTARPRLGDFVKLKCNVNKIQKNYFAVVVDVSEESDFSERFLAKSGTAHVCSGQEDGGLTSPGSPDHRTWEIVKPGGVSKDNEEHQFVRV